jgi:hypothetical protein
MKEFELTISSRSIGPIAVSFGYQGSFRFAVKHSPGTMKERQLNFSLSVELCALVNIPWQNFGFPKTLLFLPLW